MMDRRTFLRTGLSAATLLALGKPTLADISSEEKTVLTVLHTNDTHSQIEPLTAGPNVGKGGIARRMSLIKAVRRENPHTLLVDAGDVCQGTPYFNYYRGEVEYRAMSLMGYDAGTIGNHEYDNGVESLAKALSFAKFPLVSANYDFSKAPSLRRIVKPYVVKTVGSIRVGIFGLGVDFKNLVLEENHVGVSYRDPVEISRQMVKQLREVEHVHFVMGLSHLGYFKNDPYAKAGEIRLGDITVAEQVEGIDFIVGGHTHTFMKEPDVIKRPGGGQTVLFQVGYAGINLGRVDFTFHRKKLVAFHGRIIGDGAVADHSGEPC
ncbi:MAG: metallophosphoesterase [Blastocatellia bacterium]|nr:metallophosphoesterase [Blastocatellia bacterium]